MYIFETSYICSAKTRKWNCSPTLVNKCDLGFRGCCGEIKLKAPILLLFGCLLFLLLVLFRNLSVVCVIRAHLVHLYTGFPFYLVLVLFTKSIASNF